MSKMFCLDVSELDVVLNDGAPSSKKEYIIWNPPPIDPEDLALGRRSSISEASRLMRFLMRRGIRVILFCKVNDTMIVSIPLFFNDLLSSDSESL